MIRHGLYPKLIPNPKYKTSKKRGYYKPSPHDARLNYVPVACGKCYECRKKKVREWRIRLFLERIRKETGKSMKHWCVTEKGHTNTRRIHLHGIFYAPNGMTQFRLINILRTNWIDGYCYNGKYCNEKTINYVSKYMTKKDMDNPEYTGKVL